MVIEFGREICGELPKHYPQDSRAAPETREWLVTNGTGSYAQGTVCGELTRRYHGLLIAALNPPVGRTLLLAKLEETAGYEGRFYSLFANRWADGTVEPQGYRHIERFHLDGAIPVWSFAFADALLEKRVWMQQGANTTYIRYTLRRSTKPVSLRIEALVNYRDHHHLTRASDRLLRISGIERGVCVTALTASVPFYLLSAGAAAQPAHEWYYNFYLTTERDRGLDHCEDHLHAVTFYGQLQPGESLTIVATTESNPNLNGEEALEYRRAYEQKLLKCSQKKQKLKPKKYVLPRKAPAWVKQLVLAADQFIVNRQLPDAPEGKTIIAGYPWFSDWGRDTMISLPGLTLCSGRPKVAKAILRTFARYVDRGMLPNRFPDAGEAPDYNTVDATLWYFEAIRAYYEATGNDKLIEELWPVLAEIVNWHLCGTRYNICVDPNDGLIYAGDTGVQLTWMDAKVGDWVVTPRTGKPVEVNALWYNALQTMVQFARRLGYPYQEYEQLACRAIAGFSRFWNPDAGYCYDVLDTPTGNDASLRPNQILAVSLQHSPLTPVQQRAVVEACGRSLLTSHGLRSLSQDEPQYIGHYGGSPLQRDGAYHRGTVWGWLLGPFVLAHLRVYNNPGQAQMLLQPMGNHILAHGVGSLSEIFEGDAPMLPRGSIAQAWTVAEVLRAWVATERAKVG